MSSDNLWMNFELCFLNFNQVRFIFKETRAEHLFMALRRPLILSSTWMTLPVFPNVDDCKQNARGSFYELLFFTYLFKKPMFAIFKSHAIILRQYIFHFYILLSRSVNIFPQHVTLTLGILFALIAKFVIDA